MLLISQLLYSSWMVFSGKRRRELNGAPPPPAAAKPGSGELPALVCHDLLAGYLFRDDNQSVNMLLTLKLYRFQP